MWTVTARNCELDMEWDEDFRPRVPAIGFTGFVDDQQVFTFEPEQGSRDWSYLAEFAAASATYTIDWRPSNGSAYIIVCDDGFVTFTTARHGDGRGATCHVHVPATACVDAFRDAARMTLEWTPHDE